MGDPGRHIHDFLNPFRVLGLAGCATPARVALGLLLSLAALATGCDDEPGTTETETGQANGARCLVSEAGAGLCQGDVCVALAGEGTAIGVCSESCTDTCRFGGVCTLRTGAERACLVPCETSGDCAEGFNCQPVTGARICTTGDCVNPVDNLFCVPPT